jgi:hypothetical protein
MVAADQYERWQHRDAAGDPISASASPAAESAPTEIAQAKSSVPVYQVLTSEACLLLVDRLFDAGDIATILRHLDTASGSADDPALQMEVCQRYGRYWLEMNDPACEQWLRKADQLCVKTFGESSARRVPIQRLLMTWYSISGEVDLVLQCGSTVYELIGDTEIQSPKRRFINKFAHAVYLRLAGRYQESVAVLRGITWEIVLGRTDDMPSEFPVPVKCLETAPLSRPQLANLELLYAMNCTDERDYELAESHLQIARHLMSGVNGHDEVNSMIEQEAGRVRRKTGDYEMALRHY